MEAPLPRPAPPPRPRVGSRADVLPAVSTSCGVEETPLSAEESSPSGSMPPPPLPAVATPSNAAHAGAATTSTGAAPEPQDDTLETRSSRSASTASRSNRLSLTLPIAPPTAFPSRPTPASSATTSSFPATPVDLASGLVSPADPADLITAIAAQERRVLELREELVRAESGLSKLKRQWATFEAQKKRAEIRRTEPLRSLSTKPGPTAAADSPATPLDDSGAKRNLELERRKALLLGQQTGSDPNTPTQSRRRVFRGGHARTLSLLSPTKASSDSFSVHEDQPDDGSAKSPTSPHASSHAVSHEPDSPFYQNLQQLGRYGEITAAQLSKRASWAPQSVHQVAGLKQVAGDLTATLWTFVEDLRQATVGDEPITGGSGAMRNIDPNTRVASNEELQNTIRASANSSARPHVAKAFAADVQATPTPPPRHAAAVPGPAGPQAASKEKPAAATGGSKSKSSKASKPADAKAAKRFSWTPLTVEAYDDSDWSSWDSPTVKSPRWSGSTVNGESVASSIPEQGDEVSTPQKNRSSMSPSSPIANKINDLNWPAALNRLTPGNIKRTAADLMKEWEKSLSPPAVDVAATETTIQERST